MINKSSIPNPLYEPQREKSGATTFDKYAYQYHWGLYKIISQHEKLNEYAVFIELHEDVVIANSLDGTKAEFQFCQVKNIDTKFTNHNLTKLKKGSSVLGKLIDSCIKKKYSHAINDIMLVAVKGFSLDLKEKNLAKEHIQITDIVQSSFDEIQAKIIKEVSCTEMPKNLYFVVPKLPAIGFQETVIGQIASLIYKLFPSSTSNSVDIYRSLIDELNRKGANKFDYEKWDEALEKKALTSLTVTKVINKFTEHKDARKLTIEFNEICKELNLNVISKRRLEKSFNRYKLQKIGSKTVSQMKVVRTIKKLIKKHIDNCEEDIEILINLISEDIPQPIKSKFPNQNDLNGAIIYEYIVYEE